MWLIMYVTLCVDFCVFVILAPQKVGDSKTTLSSSDDSDRISLAELQ